jgi:hypothetical protein
LPWRKINKSSGFRTVIFLLQNQNLLELSSCKNWQKRKITVRKPLLLFIFLQGKTLRKAPFLKYDFYDASKILLTNQIKFD